METGKVKDALAKAKETGCAAIEIYRTWGTVPSFHMEKNTVVEEDSCIVREMDCIYSIFNEEEYRRQVLAGSYARPDFLRWYGNKDANVIVIVLTGGIWLYSYELGNEAKQMYFSSKEDALAVWESDKETPFNIRNPFVCELQTLGEDGYFDLDSQVVGSFVDLEELTEHRDG